MNTTQAQAPPGALVPGRGGVAITPSFLSDPRAGVQPSACVIRDVPGVTTTDMGDKEVN